MSRPDEWWDTAWRRARRAARALDARVRRLDARILDAARAGWRRASPALGRAVRPLGRLAAPLGRFAPRRTWRRLAAAGRMRALLGWARAHAPRPAQLAVLVGVILLVDWGLWETCGLGGCPDVARLTSYQPGGASALLDRHGRKFADLRPFDRAVVRLSSLPDYVAKAFVAVEDKRFYQHHGVDWRRVVGSALADLRAGAPAEGFSTLSMQLARNVWHDRIPGEERTLRRKLLEIRVAREIEHRFTKPEILELYLNHIYFGEGAYGIEAAAENYFHEHSKDLDLAQAATLAALPKAPSTYDPRRHPERARTRRNLVLALMVEQKRASPAAARKASAEKLGVPRHPPRTLEPPGFARYYVEEVRRELEDRFGDEIYDTPLRIVTTLDVDAEKAAEQELAHQLHWIERGGLGREHGPRYGASDAVTEDGTKYLQGAVVVMDVHSGDVLALVGGRDYRDSGYDRALEAHRQLGSAFKPFVYATALLQGYVPTQPIMDEPVRVGRGRNAWEPRNYDGRFRGVMTMRDALVHSENVPAVRLALRVGEGDVARVAHQVGIRSDIPSTPSMALGTAEVSPLEVTSAYTAFASLGRRAEPRLIRRVLDYDGHVLWAPEERGENVIDPGVAYVVTDMLRDVVDRGTGAAVRQVGFWGAAAGKTGTTSDNTDAWFVGYTPDIAASVWIGFDARRPIAHAATGGGAAAPVWGRIMRRIYAHRPMPQEWGRPSDVVLLPVDPPTGLVLQAGCRPSEGDAASEVFLASRVPASVCPRDEREDDTVGGVIGSVWAAVRGIFGGHDYRPPPPPPAPSSEAPGPTDPLLGAPRLPMESPA